MATNPFVCLPDAAIWQPGLSAHAKCLFAALLSYRNRRTGMCNPRLTLLADRLGKSLRTIKRALDQLRRAGMVIVQRTLFGNRYEIATPDQWGFTMSRDECGAKCGPSARANRGLTQGPSVASQEPDVLNHMGDEPDADAAVVSSPLAKTAATAAAVVVSKPKKPTPPVPAVSGSVNENSGHMAETEKGNFPQNFPGEFFPSGEAAKIAGELMAVHPEPGNLPKAVAEVAKLLASSAEGVPAAVEAIRVSHAAWRVRWAEYGAGRFIPQLWRWIHDGDWRNPPVSRKEVKSETWIERRKREYKESEERSYRNYAELGAWEILRDYGGDELVEEWRAKVADVA